MGTEGRRDEDEERLRVGEGRGMVEDGKREEGLRVEK